jgi:dienelactone hydrolase
MRTSHVLFASLLLLGSLSGAWASVSIPVQAKVEGQALKGTLYLPDHAKGALPLVAVVHEWWGKTDYPEMRARKIADELGYAALAADVYGDGRTADNPKDAMALAGPFYQDPSLGVKRLQALIAAAPDAAKDKAMIDPGRIAAIGYCFGGTQALNLARSGGLPAGEKLRGVVSFHGGLASSLKATAPVETKLLVLHGAADKMVSEKEVTAFKDEMKAAKADMRFHAYPGALHAFTNPGSTENGKKFGIPIAYDAKADQDSWSRMKRFLKEIFGS